MRAIEAHHISTLIIIIIFIIVIIIIIISIITTQDGVSWLSTVVKGLQLLCCKGRSAREAF